MDDDDRTSEDRPVRPPSTQQVDAARRAGTETATAARRDALDREEREIKDAVLRMGALVEEAIRDAIARARRARCRAGAGRHQGRRVINEAQRESRA